MSQMKLVVDFAKLISISGRCGVHFIGRAGGHKAADASHIRAAIDEVFWLRQ
jgi:hypothetical protein